MDDNDTNDDSHKDPKKESPPLYLKKKKVLKDDSDFDLKESSSSVESVEEGKRGRHQESVDDSSSGDDFVERT